MADDTLTTFDGMMADYSAYLDDTLDAFNDILEENKILSQDCLDFTLSEISNVDVEVSCMNHKSATGSSTSAAIGPTLIGGEPAPIVGVPAPILGVRGTEGSLAGTPAVVNVQEGDVMKDLKTENGKRRSSSILNNRSQKRKLF